MHSECNHQKAREVVMSQAQWEVWPSGSPEIPDCLAPEQEVAFPSSTEESGKQIQLPKQLEAVRRAAEFPYERHRWNTNEEVAAILIAFDKHESWERQEVRTRPPSGTMLLYSRKKVRYRKDGYCWKKRKDGKTTREDHMKLKVQGIECIYGSYVHSAILPTFHRRCYWLLQNPDLVLVHYLNVPLTDDNKICLPPILQVDFREWSQEDLVSQLRPMFASVKHFDMTGSGNETSEDAVESLVKHILSSSTNSTSSTPVQMTSAVTPQTVSDAVKTISEVKVAPSAPNSMHNRLLQLIYSHKVSPGGATTTVPCVIGPTQVNPGQLGLTVCDSGGGNEAVFQGFKPTVGLNSSHKLTPHNGPLILNISPMPGSKGLLILSSQATAPKGTFSLLQPAAPMPGTRIDLVTLQDKPDSSRATDCADLPKKPFQPIFNRIGSTEDCRAQTEPSGGKTAAAPCYNVSDYLNHGDILGQFDLQQVVKTELKDDLCETPGGLADFPGVACSRDFAGATCVSEEQSSVSGNDAPDLQQIGLESMEFLFADSGLTDHEHRSIISDESDIKCEFFGFPESSNADGRRTDLLVSGSAVHSGASTCLTDNMDTSGTGNQKDLDDIKALHSNDLMMDELEDILHIVSESLGHSDDLTNTFSLSDDHETGVGAISQLYQCPDTADSGLSSSGQAMSAEKKPSLGSLQNETHASQNERSFDNEGVKSGLVEITDYCPEWSYTEGGTKVLVTGPWHQMASSYSVMFDDLSVPTSMVQGGVLRCFAPAHCPAVVCLRVAYNSRVISEPKVFEYKSRDQSETGNETDWFLVQERQLKDSLVQRFMDVEKSLMKERPATSLLSSEATENVLVSFVDRLSEQPLTARCSAPAPSPSRLSILHLSAALGFSRLCSALIRWRNNSLSLVTEQEVDSLSTDIKGNTPLMWACARGHSDTVTILAHWSPSSIYTSNKSNWYPVKTLRHFGYHSIADLLQQISSSHKRSDDDCLVTLRESGVPSYQGSYEGFEVSANASLDEVELLSPEQDPIISQLFVCSPMSTGDVKTPVVSKSRKSHRDLRVWTETATETSFTKTLDDHQTTPTDGASDSDTYSPVLVSTAKGSDALKRTRLMKRTSVDILPDYPQFHNELVKLSRTGAHPDGDEDGNARENPSHVATATAGDRFTSFTSCLRASSSDPHLSNLFRSSLSGTSGADPMISRIDRDLNSPVLFLQSNTSFDEDKGLSLEDVQRETVAMDMDSPVNLEGLSYDDGSEMLQSASVEADDSLSHSNQMMTLASQIIAALPERIKISPSHSKQLLMDEINSRRDRTSSYGSFSSCSSSTPPVCITEDSGISTPLEGMSFLEYRYSDMGTPASTLSPTSTCIQSPYSFGIDSPPPTTAEFTEYFNAPAMYMEKDFSQLTLSDEEQRRLYEAAKIIQNFYRKYKDKKEQQLRQQQKEIEAAILIQSYYRRYKQFMYYKRMTQAAVLIQSQFRSYYAQKRFRRSREAATIIQNRYRAYKEHERYKKSRNAAVIIQQRFRSHYQRTLAGRQSNLADTVHKMMADGDVSSDLTDAPEPGIADSDTNRNSSEREKPSTSATKEDEGDGGSVSIATGIHESSSSCHGCKPKDSVAGESKEFCR